MKWKVGSKIGAGFGAALMIFAIVGFVAWRNVQQQIEDVNWVSHTHEVINTLAQLLAAMQDAEDGQRGYIITADERYFTQYTEAVKSVDSDVRHVNDLVSDNPRQTARAEALRALTSERIAALKDVIDTRRSKGLEAAQSLMLNGPGKRTMDGTREVLQSMAQEEDRLLVERSRLAERARAISNNTIIWGTALAVLIGALAGIIITRNVAGPLGDLTRAAERITIGDLGASVNVGDRADEVGELGRTFDRMTTSLRAMAGVAEQIAGGDLRATVTPLSPQDVLGHAFVKMIANLRQQIGGLVEGASVLGSAASEIVASTAQLAAGASESAAAVSETTTTVEEIRQTAQMASQKARLVSDTAQRVVLVASGGRKSTEEVANGMSRIRLQMEAIGSSMMRLSEQTQAIGQIIATVDDLAAQSNLLAVNAAIEAAKAGEQGKGFGVVAQEVKSLAEQSRAATDRVRTILGDIQKATTAAVMATEQGNKAVEAGDKQSQSAGDSILALAGSVNEAAQAATQIAASSQQQLVGMDQVAGAMENIKQASTQNVASARQLESAARNLSELGQRLKTLTENYSV